MCLTPSSILQMIGSVECVYWTEPKATCHAYNNYLSQMAGVILTFFGVFISVDLEFINIEAVIFWLGTNFVIIKNFKIVTVSHSV